MPVPSRSGPPQRTGLKKSHENGKLMQTADRYMAVSSRKLEYYGLGRN